MKFRRLPIGAHRNSQECKICASDRPKLLKKLIRFTLPLLAIFQILALLVASEKPAQAYVDPGSGLLVFQVLGSMVAGALYFLRYRIRKLFGLKTDESNPAKTENPPSSAR